MAYLMRCYILLSKIYCNWINNLDIKIRGKQGIEISLSISIILVTMKLINMHGVTEQGKMCL